MGMAAGQARLLSITTRMSDNELRAQIINNDKMRLATESSRVSENYVAALNESELMFANYDANNNASYQNLTFNALTSYNPYNNQYGLINSAGNILVSEKDADNFKLAGGDVNRFLKAYGLEYTTTFFDNLLGQNGEPVGYNSSSMVFYSIGETDENGNVLVDQPSGFTAAQLEKMYRGIGETNMRGGAKIDNSGYDQIMQEGNYYDYLDLLDNYNSRYDEYLKFVSSGMDEVLDGLFKQIFDGKGVSEVKNLIQSAGDTKTMKDIMLKLAAVSSLSRAYMYKDGANYDNGNKFFTDLEKYLKDNSQDRITDTTSAGEYTILVDSAGTHFFATLDSDGNIDEIVYSFKGGIVYGSSDSTDAGTTFTQALPDYKTNYNFTSVVSNGKKVELPEDHPMHGKDLYYTTGVSGDFSITYDNTLEDMKIFAESALDSLKSGIYSVWDASNPIWQTTDAAKGAYENFKAAAIELGKFIYGDSYTGNNPPVEDLGDASKLYNKIGEGYPSFTDTMYSVFQALVLDAIMNTYGEPNYAWIDTSSRTDSYNENGAKKAQWYQNLFNRMSQGYSVILDGLASSADWIKFAFENGIVTMEQIDNKNAWNSLSYTNCSDIIEETKDKAVAKAEAEYKAAMNKIENKDKRYDLELKNIDTEHNSLQTEYDSIKEAINKNIERVFKMYM